MDNRKASEFDKVLGAWDILVIAFGAMIGWGWVVSSGDWIGAGGVIGAAIGFALGGIMVFFVGLTYAASMYSATGQWGPMVPLSVHGPLFWVMSALYALRHVHCPPLLRIFTRHS